MYHTINEFLQDWKYEADSTLRVFKVLTDASLAQRVSPEGRDIRTLAWHIVTSLPEMTKRVGLGIEGVGEHDPAPDSAAAIARSYEAVAESLRVHLAEAWTDETLAAEHDMYGEMWNNAKTLSVLLVHQIHHRAQLSVLMRQAGLRVPGIYGPAREEWEAMGMPAQP
jgi:uncharacterized damage-inducible protein DinB